MVYPYVGEIKMFAGKFAPDGWALCDGRLLPIAENHFLFQVLGNSYGGDGILTFGLPDLRKCLPIHQDEGPGDGARTFSESEPYLYVNYIISLYGIFSPRD
ncbi:phage tail protein [Dyadobacter sandarakinus]|uniref:Tail fiber protein n=1 Tax=Dyadobacter sandarakinus TaxID=2747268 RepID=A0ABX7I2U2_9BACT|nr:tail fiber protein [Dyadobacter sandarakinus]QRR00203.1 tail fiber protein [Dyadobacter sandarakinus]